MVHVSPGLRYLASGAVYSSLPVIGGLGAQHLLNMAFDAHIPTWVVIVASLATFPVGAIIRMYLKEWKDRRDAAIMGAQMVPKLAGRWLGNLDIFLKVKEVWASGYPSDHLEDVIAFYGPVFNLPIMYSDLYMTASPEHLKVMLVTDFPNYVKGEEFHKAMNTVLGSGVFNSDGDMWKFHRSLTRPAFTRDRTSDYELFDRHAGVVISQLKQRLHQGFAVDFQDLMSRFTLDTVTEFLFGNCVHSLAARLPYLHRDNATPPSIFTDTNCSVSAFSQAMIASHARFRWILALVGKHLNFGHKTN